MHQFMSLVFKNIVKLKEKFHIPKATNISIENAKTMVSDIYTEHECCCNDVILEESEGDIDLSIIIPVYNASAYIERCVNSLLEQKTEYNYEIILINDGSTDDTLSILEKYKMKTNIIIISQQNQGISNTRNRGIKIAKGKYIGFVDNDDAVSSDYVQKLLQKAFEIDADMVKCGIKTYSGKQPPILDILESKDYLDGLKQDVCKYDGFVWGGIYKRKMWKNFKFPANYWYEDMVTRLNLMVRSRVFAYIGEPLYIKYYHNDNASKKVWDPRDYKCIDQLFLVKQLYELTEYYHIKVNETYLELILYELGPLLLSRTRRLKRNHQKAVFVLATELVQSIPIFEKCYNENDRLHRAFKICDYVMWRDASLYLKLKEMQME